MLLNVLDKAEKFADNNVLSTCALTFVGRRLAGFDLLLRYAGCSNGLWAERLLLLLLVQS